MKTFLSAVVLGAFTLTSVAAYAQTAVKPVIKSEHSCHSEGGSCKHCSGQTVNFAPVTVGSLEFTEGFVRPAVAKNVPTAAYITINNRSGATEKLLKIESTKAVSASLHDTTIDNQGVMRMKEIESGVEIKSGESFSFKPRSAHLMLIGVKEKINAGDLAPIDFYFKNAGKITLSLPVNGGKDSGGKPCCCKHHKADKP